ncbi:7-carboxy-7-deazaguanine synthase QueE [Actinomadura sp. 3N508]|uniref:7-carboxy-7-deazaguanine synthase QueE n=1 Tax=Actinomadura sp. 3N508 TaxID=3375153 RepID=UPI0037A01B97
MSSSIPLAVHRTGLRPAPVAELFYSFQGEGVNLGRRALFVRFRDCNLTCGYARAPRTAGAPVEGRMRCDTEYTWNRAAHDFNKGVRHLTSDEIWDELMVLDPSTASPSVAPVDLIVVSGGEPLLHKDTLVTLAQRATSHGRRVEIETNATIRPGPELVATGAQFNAAPKLASSAMPRKKRIKPDAISELRDSGQARWKFVVCGPDDLAEIAELQQEFGLTEIWLSPEGTTPAAVIERMRMAADAALTHGWNLTTREHVLIWGDERGR